MTKPQSTNVRCHDKQNHTLFIAIDSLSLCHLSSHSFPSTAESRNEIEELKRKLLEAKRRRLTMENQSDVTVSYHPARSARESVPSHVTPATRSGTAARLQPSLLAGTREGHNAVTSPSTSFGGASGGAQPILCVSPSPLEPSHSPPSPFGPLSSSSHSLSPFLSPV